MTRSLLKISVLLTLVFAASFPSPGSLVAQQKTPNESIAAKKSTPPRAWPPRTADGQPDISGVWGGVEEGQWTGWLEDTYHLYHLGLAPFIGPYQKRPGAPAGAFTKRDSALIDPPDRILPYHPWALERRNSVMRNYASPEPWQVDSQTPGWPSGIPRENAYSSTHGNFGGPIQILQPPGYVVFLYETHHEFRIVPLDGRPHPGQDIKLWEGASRGRWEGTTLVIDVKNNNDSPRMSVIGDFRSDQMTAQERWNFVDNENITYRVTVTDPKVFTRPWTAEWYYKRAPAGTELMEYAGVEGASPFFGFTREGDSRNHIK